jgi:DNA-binding transcriptional LysR family regulator
VQLHQLRYAVVVAEERGFTRAAARLHIAQPSVSGAVHTLERELGMALFHRSRGDVTLTAGGQAFLPWARQVLADCEAGRAAVRNLLPPVLSAFHHRHPGIELMVHEAGSPDLVTGLEQGQLDVALVILPVQQGWVETELLSTEELVLAVSPDHPLAGRELLDLAALRDLPLVMFRDGYDLREATFAACRTAGFEPVLAVEGLEMDGVLALTEAGLGASVVPASVAPRAAGLRTVAFRNHALTRGVGVASRRDRPMPHAAVAFVEELRRSAGPRSE